MHSTSDYHHNRRRPKHLLSEKRPQSYIHAEPGSRYSIISSAYGSRTPQGDEMAESRTVESYDPFCASKGPMQSRGNSYTNVTILRAQSNEIRRRTTGSVKHIALARAQAMDQVQHNSRTSVESAMRGRASQRGMVDRRSVSKGSIGSHSRGASPAVVSRSSSKRGVSFQHARRNSGVRKVPRPHSPRPKKQVRRKPAQLLTPESAAPPSSPPELLSPIIRSKKTSNTQGGKSRTPSHIWTEETRKASTELSALIDEAFRPRSSVGSSIHTTNTEINHDFKTPVSSFTDREVSASPRPIARKENIPAQDRVRSLYENRPLPPPPPAEKLDSFTASALEETRARLIRRAAEDNSGASQAYLDDVIRHIDTLIFPNKPPKPQSERRIVSASPDCRVPHESAYLPAITEEFRHAGDERSSIEQGRYGFRNSSDPNPRPRPETRRGDRDERSTIRLVTPVSPSPLPPVAPFSVRKRGVPVSNAVPMMSGAIIRTSQNRLDENEYRSKTTIHGHTGTKLSFYLPRDLLDQELETIPEATGRESRAGSGEGKKKDWWRRPTSAEEQNQAVQSNENSWPLSTEPLKENRTKKPDPPSYIMEPKTIDVDTRKTSGAKKGFLKIFGKRASKSKVEHHTLSGELENLMSHLILTKAAPNPYSSQSLTSEAEDNIHRDRASYFSDATSVVSRPVVAEQHWLARMFRIKPATKILCFQVPKRRARREIVTILREWRKYGMKDVVSDRVRNTVFARVDATNCVYRCCRIFPRS
jgi:serine/threonine-protein kinase HSL1 (negative regulator of Swe1 kinase)